jgi:hypothetical protein
MEFWRTGDSIGIGNSFLVYLALIGLALFETEIYLIRKWQRKNQREVLNDSSFFTYRVYALPPPPDKSNPSHVFAIIKKFPTVLFL